MSGITVREALERLKRGNRRYVEGRPALAVPGPERRRAHLRGQKPIAAVLACSDARTSPEIVFDQDLGELFVVRVAGNVSAPDVSGSIEFAVEQLGVQLCVVLGHHDCGAVAAALAGRQGGGDIQTILAAIAPAVAAVRGAEGDPFDNVAREHARRTARALAADEPVLAAAVRAGRLTILPAFYDLASGAVTWLQD